MIERRPGTGIGAALIAATLLVGVLVATPAAGALAPTPARNECFVASAYQTFLDRNPTEGEQAMWAGRFAGPAGRTDLPGALANSDEWLGVEVAELYADALDRGPEPDGRAYWVNQLRRGALVNQIGSAIYGSPEFYANAGGADPAFVSDLYRRILDRDAEEAGLDYWVSEIDQRGRGGVAAQFFGSSESRTDRVDGLYQRLLGREPDAGGRSYWANQLLAVNDVRLASMLATSAEFYARAQGCGAEQPTPPPSTDADNASSANPHGWFEAGRVWRGDMGDPHIVRDGRYYYAYASPVGGRYLPVLRSVDLETWYIHPRWSDNPAPWQGGPDPHTDPSIPAEIRAAGMNDGNTWNMNDALVRPPSWGLYHQQGSWLERDYWAPGVTRIGDAWYAYGAVRTSWQSDDPNGYGRFCLTVARGPGPWGPFRDISGSGPILCDSDPAGSIDPAPFRDPRTDETYLTWKAAGKVGSHPSRLKSVRLGGDGRPTGPVTDLLSTREGSWEGFTIENPSMAYWEGTYYLFYSANDSNTANYATGYAVCPNGPRGGCHRPTPDPLLATSATEQGPGGASAFIDAQGQLRLAYHFFWPGEQRSSRPRRMNVGTVGKLPNGHLWVRRP